MFDRVITAPVFFIIIIIGGGVAGLLLTWFNFNFSMDNNYIHYKVWDEITYPLSNFNGCTVEVWEWMSNLIPHFNGHAIIYPRWDNAMPNNNNNVIRHWIKLTQVNKRGYKPLSQSDMAYCVLDHSEQTSTKIESKCSNFHKRKLIWKCPLQNDGHLISAAMCWIRKWMTK